MTSCGETSYQFIGIDLFGDSGMPIYYALGNDLGSIDMNEGLWTTSFFKEDDNVEGLIVEKTVKGKINFPELELIDFSADKPPLRTFLLKEPLPGQ